MKRLIASTAMAALLAAPLTAEGEKPMVPSDPKPAPPYAYPDESSGGGVDLLPILLGVILVGIAASNRGAQPDLSEPRPQVRPQTCMNKHGVIVACER